MTNKELLMTALKQSAEDNGCNAGDFLREENVLVPFHLGANARKYLKEPIVCNLVSYGSNIVAAVSDGVADLVSAYIGRYEFYHCFETPNLHWLNERLAQQGSRICFMAEYYLPDVNRMPALSCPYETRLLRQADFEALYIPEWSNALYKDRKHLDVLGVGARIIGEIRESIEKYNEQQRRKDALEAECQQTRNKGADGFGSLDYSWSYDRNA